MEKDCLFIPRFSPRIVMEFEQGVGNPTISTIEKIFKGSGLQLTLGRKRRITKVS